MEEKNHEQERKFIHEKIVPRKRFKKVLLTVLSVVVLAALFGAIAGVVYSLTRNLLGEGEGNGIQTIVIARPEATEEGSTGSTQASTEAEKESEEAQEKEQEEKRPSNEKEIIPSVPTIETRIIYEGMSERTKEVYNKVSQGLVLISTETGGELDWLNRERAERKNLLGALIAESDDTYFVLADSASIPADALITATVGQQTVPALVISRDSYSGICILSLDKSDFNGTPRVIALGSSAASSPADEVYLVGMAEGRFGSVDCGLVTYEAYNVSVVDGYQQLIYTNIGAAAGTAAALFNSDSELIGWVSAGGERTEAGNAVAAGISPLKYLIEDLCSGIETAYLGVVCMQISDAEAATYDIPAGYYIQEVYEDSPAYTEGIQPGDRIVNINGTAVTSNRTMQHIMDELRPGDEIRIELERKGASGFGSMDVTVRVTAR